jgi:cleavage and polyadenylation specificity factor subunit 1
MVEAREFCIYTDHKPVTFAYNLKSTQLSSPRQCRHLDYISQFTTDIYHIAGAHNVVADALSRIEEVNLPMDYQALTVAQQQDQELRVPAKHVLPSAEGYADTRDHNPYHM